MATLKATILQNFATVGIPDFEEAEDPTEPLGKNWSIVALSENLINEDRLVGLQHLNTRRLDLVIHNGSKFALLNLQAFKILDCEVATNTIRQCLTYHLTPNGNLLLGVQPSGDIVILTDGLQEVKILKKPTFIKLQQRQPKWYDGFPSKIAEFLGFSKSSKSNQIYPETPLQSVEINGSSSRHMVAPSVTPLWSSFSLSVLKENVRRQYPYLTCLPDGLVILCAFSPTDCYIFLSSYETALRVKSVANIRGTQVPGHWYRVIMYKHFISKWLDDKRQAPCFEARLCNDKDEYGLPSVGGAMVYATMQDMRLELVYGLIRRRVDKFTLSWEELRCDVDWAVRDGHPYNLGSRFVTKLSSDCKKIVIVLSNHLGMYVHVQEIPFYSNHTIRLKREKVSLCTHSDYDGTHFYKQECWVADVQWLVEDAYFAVITLCGSLSIFHSSGDPMILKVRKPGPESDEQKSARFYFPVFHPHQIVRGDGSPKWESNCSCSPQVYPTLKWIDTEQVLTCSSGMKIELFSIQRVIPFTLEKEQNEIWLGDTKSDVVYVDGLLKSGRDVWNSDTGSSPSHRSSDSETPSVVVVSDAKAVLKPDREGRKDNPTVDVEVEITYNRRKANYSDPEEDVEENGAGSYFYINDVETPSHIEELPSDLGEVFEENLEEIHILKKGRVPQKLQSEHEMGVSEKENDAVIEVECEMNVLSLPESLTKVNEAYNEELTEVSSEPDVDEDIVLTAPATTPLPQGCVSCLKIGIEEGMSAHRKRSQLYMADDEADEDETRHSHPALPRKRSVGKSYHGSRDITPGHNSTAAEEEDSDHPPLSAYDTECSQETYSSPFSYAPTSAENEGDEQDEPVLRMVGSPHVPPNPLVEMVARSQNGTTTSLQIPAVPKISGVIVSSERRSAMLTENIEEISGSSPEQQTVMEYKQPTTASFVVGNPSAVDMFHFAEKPTKNTSLLREEETREDVTLPEEEDEPGPEDNVKSNGNEEGAASDFSSSNRDPSPSRRCRYFEF